MLAALSDDLVLPFLQIRSTLELFGIEKYTKKTAPQRTQEILLSVESGLQLLQAYRLALASGNAEALPLEPVAVGAVLQDVAHQLDPYAKQYSTQLQIDVRGRLKPVLAHRPSLVAAIQILSASLIRAQNAESHQKSYNIMLAAHKNGDSGIAAGVYSNMQGLSDKTLRSARSLVGKARQPIPGLPSGAASGVLIADTLCAVMWAPLRASAHRGMNGLSTSVPSSKQLNFV